MMKKNVNILLLGLSASAVFAAEPLNRISYALGVELAKPAVQILKENENLYKESILAGVSDSLAGGELKMTDQEIRAELTAFIEQMNQKRENELKLVAEKNKIEGENYLATHKKEKGTIALPSGIQYKVLSSGSSKSHPGPKDTVTTHYRGILIDGTQFDSSYDRGEPAKFALDQVISGWTEVLQLMSPGDKWQVVIPAELAYGQYAPSTVIGPNKTLIFDIELLETHKS